MTEAEGGFFPEPGETPEQPEIVEGLFREQQLVVLVGAYGSGKSPWLISLVLALLSGRSLFGRAVERRPVVVIDFETSDRSYTASMRAQAAYYGLPLPNVPDEAEIYLDCAAPNHPLTSRLRNAVSDPRLSMKTALLTAALSRKPNAVVIVDPFEWLYMTDTNSKSSVQEAYHSLRHVLGGYPHAAIIIVLNLRKRDRRAKQPADLLSDPRGWLEDVSGSLNLLSRSDVRLGMEKGRDDVVILNGIRRGEDCTPLAMSIHFDAAGNAAGFVPAKVDPAGVLVALSPEQMQHWARLPNNFRFTDVKDVPHSSLARLLRAAQLMNVLRLKDGFYTKL